MKDSKKDQKKMQPEATTMDMPEVKDIPGQENIRPPQFREMQDITISSADEEGVGILDNLNEDEEPVPGNSSDVTRGEKRLLKKSAGHQPAEQQRAHQHGKAGFAERAVRCQQRPKEGFVSLE